MHCGALSRERGSHVARNPAFGLLLGVALAGWALLARPEAPGATTTAAAVLLLAATAGLLVGAPRVGQPWRAGLVCAAVATTVLCALTASIAGTTACVLLLAWAGVRRWGPAFVWQVVAAALLIGSVGLTVLLGSRVIAPALLTEALSKERVQLWSEAFALAEASPVRGVGAGEFARLS